MKISDNSVLIMIDGVKFKIIYDGLKKYDNQAVFFGKFKNKNYFVVETNDSDNSFINLMSYKAKENERTLAGIAKSVITWHHENLFCGKCGNKTDFLLNEPGKICNNCSNIVYTRLNPAVIVIVKKKEQILLTRKTEWINDRFGLVAGFVEYGESAEEAVKREVSEETGLSVENIKYIASQFWPFPYQLMLGFEAEYKSGEINVQTSELEQVKWFDKNNLPGLPPKSSIARYLIDIQF